MTDSLWFGDYVHIPDPGNDCPECSSELCVRMPPDYWRCLSCGESSAGKTPSNFMEPFGGGIKAVMSEYVESEPDD